jgi:hypothetical protein
MSGWAFEDMIYEVAVESPAAERAIMEIAPEAECVTQITL